MLVIISDLHLTDGSIGASIPLGAFSLFAARLRELAREASWRSDGSYRPMESIDLVLLGDVLDVIRSSRWLAGEARPWVDPQSAAVAEMVGTITTDVLRANPEAISVLGALSAPGGVTVPPATLRGKPDEEAEPLPVIVQTHYLVGNHDWFLHLGGERYDAIRRLVVDQFGLSNPSNVPFPHDPAESDVLLDTMRRHKLLARHGDIFDPVNFAGERNVSSLGDAVVIELINRFSAEVENTLADELPAAAIWGLREIDNIRPTLLTPVWIDGLLERTCPLPAQRKQVKQVWDALVDRFLQLDFVRTHDSLNPLNMIGEMERVLKFSQRISLGWATAIVEWLQRLRGSADASYYKHALAEPEFRNRRARHIIYGHTHFAENVPLDASHAEGQVLNQVYFNSGTWRRVYRPTQLSPAEHEFIPTDGLTYLAFYQGDERRGRPFETWTGMLGLAPSDAAILRVDPPASTRTGLNGPHFTRVPNGTPLIVPMRRR